MAQINGTTGNDNLVGTEFGDVINALTGFDLVDGAGGYDQLIVDYSRFVAATARFPSNVVVDAAGLSGVIESRVANDYVRFSNIEKLDVHLGSRADSFIIKAEVPFASDILTIDGGGGVDQLALYLTKMDNVSFSINGAGGLETNFGLGLTAFEMFDISVGGGSNTISTGALDDSVSVGNGTSTISTGDGTDYITTQGGRDTIDGGAGRDTWLMQMASAPGAVSFTHNGLTGAASIGGLATAIGIEHVRAALGVGNDSITLTDAENDEVNSGGGADKFTIIRPNSLSLDGGSGIDSATIVTSDEGSWVYDNRFLSNGVGGFNVDLSGAGGGNLANFERLDVTFGSSGDLVIVDLVPLQQGATLKLDGGLGEDHLILDFSSFAKAKVALAVNGSLTIAGATFAGFETFDFTGTAGNDQLAGGSTFNRIDGGAGNDIIQGGAGSDRLTGGTGNDKLYTMGGGDDLFGGLGNDSYYIDFTDVDVMITEYFGEGSDTIYSSVDAVAFQNVEKLVLTGIADTVALGNEDNNTLTGSVGNNTLFGGSGNDTIKGGAGSDRIYGDEGKDKLYGDAGFDVLSGGDGADQFIFDQNAIDGITDLIEDFAHSQKDKINLSAIDADGDGGAANGKFAFIGTASFALVRGQVRYELDGGSTYVQADINGDGVADLSIALIGATKLVATDFVL